MAELHGIYESERAAGEIDRVNVVDAPRRPKKTAREELQAAPRQKKAARTAPRSPLVDPKCGADAYGGQ